MFPALYRCLRLPTYLSLELGHKWTAKSTQVQRAPCGFRMVPSFCRGCWIVVVDLFLSKFRAFFAFPTLTGSGTIQSNLDPSWLFLWYSKYSMTGLEFLTFGHRSAAPFDEEGMATMQAYGGGEIDKYEQNGHMPQYTAI